MAVSAVMPRTARVEGARRATVLRYGGSLWVSGYWPRTILSVELRPIRPSVGRVLLIGPPSAAACSLTVELGAIVSLETFAHELADWMGTPALSTHRAEQAWPAVARGLAADLTRGVTEEIPA